MPYLFYTQLSDWGVGYKTYGFDPVADSWSTILAPPPSHINGQEVCGIDRLKDGKTYMGFSTSAPTLGRVSYHLGSSWATQNTASIGDEVTFTAMKAFSGGHFYFMNRTWGSGGNSNLYYWNGTTLVSLGVVSTNIQRMAFMDGESKDLFYICGWRPSANTLYRWNGSVIDHIGDSGGPGGGQFGGIGVIGSDIYLQAFSEDFSYWGTACCKLKKGTWGGSWTTIRDFTTTYYWAGGSQLNAIAIDRSNNNIWVLLKRSGGLYAFRYDGVSWTDYDLYALMPSKLPNFPQGIAAAEGKCMVTANSGTGTSLNTCYFNGTSWATRSLPSATEGSLPRGVSAEQYGAAFVRLGADTIGALDGPSLSLSYARSAGEAASASDASLLSMAYARSADDQAAVLDTHRLAASYVRSRSDFVTATEGSGEGFKFVRGAQDVAAAVDQGTLHPLLSRISGTSFLDPRSRRVSALVGTGGPLDFTGLSSDSQLVVELIQADEVLESLTLDPFLSTNTNTWNVTFAVPAPQNFTVRVRLSGVWKAGALALPVVVSQERGSFVQTAARRPR